MPDAFFLLKSRSCVGRLGTPDGEWVLTLPSWRLRDPCLRGTPLDWQNHPELRLHWNENVFAFAPAVYGAKPHFPIVLGERNACSAYMRSVLEKIAPGCVEYLPFRTRTSCGDDVTLGYSLMHYRHWVNAIDRDRSELDSDDRWPKLSDGGVFFLKRLVVRRKLLTSPVCRVVGVRHAFYREDIVKILESTGIDGLIWESVELS